MIPLNNSYHDRDTLTFTDTRLLILDNDVTTFNTEHLHAEAVGHVGQKYGFPVPDGLFWQTIGYGYEETYKIVAEETGIDPEILPMELWIRETQRYFSENTTSVVPCEDTMQVIEAAISRMIPIAMVSTSPARIVFECIESLRRRLKTRHQIIDFMITADDVPVEKQKPHPLPYEMAIQEARSRYRVTPDACLVLEDSVNGVTSAVKAGLLTIARPMRFPHENEADYQSKKASLSDCGAHAVVDDFSLILDKVSVS